VAGRQLASRPAGQLSHAGHGDREAPNIRRKRREAKTKGKGESAKKKGRIFLPFPWTCSLPAVITLWQYLIAPSTREGLHLHGFTTTQMGIFSRDVTCPCEKFLRASSRTAGAAGQEEEKKGVTMYAAGTGSSSSATGEDASRRGKGKGARGGKRGTKALLS